MIVALLLFGVFCFIGVFIFMLIFGCVTGNMLGVKAKQIKTRKFQTFTNAVNLPIAQKVSEVTKKYFIKLGANKIPIQESEVKQSKKDGYEVLTE